MRRIIRCSRAFAKNLMGTMAWSLGISGALGCIVGLAALGNWIAGDAGILVSIPISTAIVIAAVATYIKGDCDREDLA